MTFILDWIDIAWIPLLMLVARKDQRLWAACFVGAGMLMMRLMIDLMVSIGYPLGILPLLHTPLFIRGLWVYGLFYVLYAVLVHFSPTTRGPIFIASSLSLFFAATFVFAGVMVL